MVNNKDFEKSDSETEAFESLEELKYPQDYDSWILTLDRIIEKN